MKFSIKKSFLTAVFIFVIAGQSFASNPLFNNSVQRENNNTTIVHSMDYPAFVKSFLHEINILQKDINSSLSSCIRDMEDGKTGTLFFFIFISFIYGIIHALGPGHGKSLIASYLISEDSGPLRGIAGGLSIAFIHALSAVSIIGFIYFFLKSSIMTNFESINHVVRLVSFGIIVIIGLYLFITSALEVFKRLRSKKTSEIPAAKKSDKSFAAVIFSAGIVPCPGAAMILLFSMNMDIFYAGIISVLFMSLGMAVTISLTGICVIYIKKVSMKLPSEKTNKRILFQYSTEVLSGACIFFIGLVMLLGDVSI